MGSWDPVVVIAEAGSTRTIGAGDYGALITNRGGGALTVTLPAPSAGLKGAYVDFFQVAAGDFVLTTAAGEQLATYNNATADSLTFGTDNEEIGNGCRAICDGTSWLIVQSLGSETSTNTVGDA